MPASSLVRVQPNGFLSLTDTPAVAAAAPELIITSPLHVYSCRSIHARVCIDIDSVSFCGPSGRAAAAGLRGSGARSGRGDADHERRAGTYAVSEG